MDKINNRCDECICFTKEGEYEEIGMGYCTRYEEEKYCDENFSCCTKKICKR